MRREAVSPAITAGLALAGVLAAATPAAAEYPEKPITFVVAWSAGGATDLLTRNIQSAVSDILGTDIVIRNLAGAAGTVGTAEAANAAPDGYTVLSTPAGPVTLQPHLRDIPYDLDSFEVVCRLSSAPLGLMVPQDSEYKTVADIVEAAKASPGDVTYGSAGAGTLPHVSMVGLEQAADIELKHVPFKGSAEEMKALLGGVVDVVSEQSNLIPRYELHPVAIWAAERVPEFQDVPTMKEQGYDLSFSNWNAWLVPKGTPQEVIDRLADACERALDRDAVVEGMERMQTPIAYLGPEGASEFIRSEYQKNQELLEAAGLAR